MRAVLIKISTQEILRYKVGYPQIDITPIKSLEEDLKWLIVNNEGKPPFDSTVEKLVKVEEITEIPHPDYPELDQFKISFNIVNLDNDELDELDESEASVKYLEHIFEGEELFSKTYKKIWRRRNKDRDAPNKLTQKQTRDLMALLQPTYLWLKCGNWHQARKEINKQELSTEIAKINVQGVDTLHQFLVDEIDTYFTNNYDL